MGEYGIISSCFNLFRKRIKLHFQLKLQTINSNIPIKRPFLHESMIKGTMKTKGSIQGFCGFVMLKMRQGLRGSMQRALREGRLGS